MISEQEVMDYWNKENTRKKVLEKEGKPYFFLDGPPYASGTIHMGTAWNKVLKDYFLRYKRMHGYKVHAQPGYDTHGLPIEVKVQNEMNIKSKKEIEELGIDKFNTKCKEFATKFIEKQNQQYLNLGVWMDWEHPYITLDNKYMESTWYTFKKAWDKGFVYEGKYPIHVCPGCETAVAYNEIEYKKVRDNSIFVKFHVKGTDNDYLLIWTTTPWTLPANSGVMVHPNYDYVKVQTQAGNLWVAKELLSDVMEKLESGYTVLETKKGKELEGMEYDHPMNWIPGIDKVHRKVITSDRYVTAESGTGLVHCAPGHGLEDYMAGKQFGLEQISPVLMNGNYDGTVGKYAGKNVKATDKEIIEDLKESGALLFVENIEHDYPHCWRCETPLLFLSVDQWFIKTDFKDELVKLNKEVKWVPDWAGKRFENWLQTLGDWPVTRQRYWGIPTPIWRCECGETKCLGDFSELPEMQDYHKPFIDEVTFPCKCGKEMHRVPDIMDVWFDSGCANYASLGYPQNEEPFNSVWPVDFVLEGPDQTRGWWNSSAICSYISFEKLPFKNILQHALVLLDSKVKMSKSKGGVSPEEVIEKYNRDILRYFLLTCDYSQDLVFSWDKVEDVKKFMNIWVNTIKFFELYCEKAELKDLQPEDKWIISRVNSVQKNYENYSEEFQAFKAVLELEDFVINDLSRWYVKLIRDRTWPTYEGPDKQAAFATLYYVIEKTNKMLAPAMTFMSEAVNKELFEGESVHLIELKPVESIDEELEKKMVLAREVVEKIALLRNEKKLKLRWPVKSISAPKELEELENVLKKQCNTKEIIFEEDISVSDEIVLDEALAQEVIRKVQSLRKQNGFNVEDQLDLVVDNNLFDLVKAKVNAVKSESGKDFSGEVEVQGKTAKFSFSKA